MSSLLAYSMFQEVLFPPDAMGSNGQEELFLRRLRRFVPAAKLLLEQAPIVVFDFESTGLDTDNDQIIEIGAEKLVGFEVVEEFSSLISTDLELPATVQSLTGITPDMLAGQPTINEVMPNFLKFIDGCLLVAHNADFDFRLLKATCGRMGYDLEWPCFCTYKMSRELLPELENRKLDTLAQHFNLTFGSRHRSMGDVRVTSEVLRALITEVGDGIETWDDLKAFYSV